MSGMIRSAAALVAAVLISSGCAGSAAHSSPDTASQAAAIKARQQAREKLTAERDFSKRYEQVMERARRRGYRVIWVHPPQQHASAEPSSDAPPDMPCP